MPFGLMNTPTTFNRMMDRIFRKYKTFISTFFDDMIVYSKNEAKHRKHLAMVFGTYSVKGWCADGFY